MNQLTQTPPTMSSREIAALTGSTHDNVLKTVRKLRDEGVVFGNDTPYVHPQNGQTYSEILLDFRNSMVVVSGYSAEMRAKIIDRWQELEQKVAAAAPQPLVMPVAEAAIRVAEALNRALRLEGSQALKTVRGALALKAPEYLPLLPAYSIDAPRNEVGALLTGSGSSEVTVSITDLLESLGSAIKNQTANKRLIKLGLLADMTRPSTQGDQVRKFKAVTAKGLKYGKNITHPNNPKETQAHWFVSTGAELVRLIESV